MRRSRRPRGALWRDDEPRRTSTFGDLERTLECVSSDWYGGRFGRLFVVTGTTDRNVDALVALARSDAKMPG